MLITRLRTLGEGFLNSTGGDRLLALSEGFIKIRCAEAALQLGWTLQEGVGNKGVADFARMVDGNVEWSRSARTLFAQEGSSDLAVVAPFSMLLEIKARPDHGTKSQAQFEQMDADVGRVAADATSAFFMLFETKAYRSFSAEKEEGRGRRALMAGWFNRHFPKIASVPTAEWLEVVAERVGTNLSMLFQRAVHPGADDTILVLGCQQEAPALLKTGSNRASRFNLDDLEI